MVKRQPWLVLLLFATAFPGTIAWAAGQPRVLVIHSTRQDTQLPLLTDRDLPRILSNRLSRTVDYYAEYMDPVRIPNRQYERVLRDYLRSKYAHAQLDLVIAMGDVAWDFARKYRSTLFRGTPVVFSSRNRNVSRPVNSTGVIAEINLRGVACLIIEHNMDVVARLCRRVVVMAGGQLLVEGTPAEVVRDARVIEAYLGGRSE